MVRIPWSPCPPNPTSQRGDGRPHASIEHDDVGVDDQYGDRQNAEDVLLTMIMNMMLEMTCL